MRVTQSRRTSVFTLVTEQNLFGNFELPKQGKEVGEYAKRTFSLLYLSQKANFFNFAGF